MWLFCAFLRFSSLFCFFLFVFVCLCFSLFFSSFVFMFLSLSFVREQVTATCREKRGMLLRPRLHRPCLRLPDRGKPSKPPVKSTHGRPENISGIAWVVTVGQSTGSGRLRDPAAILFISRDTCSNSIANFYCVCFCGVSQNYCAICCKRGIAQMCLCKTKCPGGVSHHFGELLTSLEKHHAI